MMLLSNLIPNLLYADIQNKNYQMHTQKHQIYINRTNRSLAILALCYWMWNICMCLLR